MRGNRGAAFVGVLLVVVVVLGALAWMFRDRIPGFGGRSVEYTEVSPEAAASAEAKIERLRTHGDTVRLTAVELASLLRYRVADQYPHLLSNPSIAMAGDTLRLGGSVPTETLPNLQQFERIRPFLPDTTRIDMEGRLLTREPGRAAIELEEVAVAGIPVPQRYYADVLDRLGRRDEAGLPANAIEFPLPSGVGSAWVDRGQLVLAP
jgi:hypothetical protein